MSDRNRIYDLERELYDLVPQAEMPPCYWLNSDGGPSYCWPCARQARWEEMGNVGPAPFETAFYYRDPIEENIRDGIDGGFDCHADHTEHCETCGCVLSHLLTDYGQEQELDFYEQEGCYVAIDGEGTYLIGRAVMNLDWHEADPKKVAIATRLLEDAIATAKSQVAAA